MAEDKGLDPLMEQYHILKTIGSGSFGKVKLAIHRVTGEKVAVKIMDKKNLGDDLPRVKLEIAALRTLHHKHIAQLYQIIETDSTISLVLEYCPGGELFDYIVECERIPEAIARTFFRHIVSAVAFAHKNGFAHRDLKPENFLLDDEQHMKLIDFGLCANPKGGIRSQLETCCGTPAYAAPELLCGNDYFGDSADVWSLGVVLFAILCGYLPFEDENQVALYEKIKSGEFERPNWLSDSSSMLLMQMLQVDPKRRISVTRIMTHPFVTDWGRLPPIDINADATPVTPLNESVLTEMAVHYGRSLNAIRADVLEWSYDQITATYLLLANRHSKGAPIQLSFPECRPLKEINAQRNLAGEFGGDEIDARSKGSPLHNSLEGGLNDADLLLLASPPKCDSESDCSDGGGNKENQRFAKPRAPTPKRQTGRRENPVLGTPVRQPKSPEQNKLYTVDAEFVSPLRTPENRHQKRVYTYEVPGTTPRKQNDGRRVGSARKVFGSIEKGIDRVKNMLTPRKRHAEHHQSRGADPRIVRVMQNVSTISSECSAEQTLYALQTALKQNGIDCQQKGYTLRGKIVSPKGHLTFELEVCQVLSPNNILGIRRKRLKGDAWLYKRVCEQVLRLAALTAPLASNTTQI